MATATHVSSICSVCRCDLPPPAPSSFKDRGSDLPAPHPRALHLQREEQPRFLFQYKGTFYTEIYLFVRRTTPTGAVAAGADTDRSEGQPQPTARLRPASAGISSCLSNSDSDLRELSYTSSGYVHPPRRQKMEAETGSGTRATPRELQRANTEGTDVAMYQGLSFLCPCTRTSLCSPEVQSERRKEVELQN